MLTAKGSPSVVLPVREKTAGTGFEGHGFFEAASIRKFNDIYYLVYASELNHELCYATSREPDKNFIFRGTIISNGDVGLDGREEKDCLAPTGNIHGGLIEAGGNHYIFYHRHTHGTMFSRQGCAELVTIGENGHIAQVEVTTSGFSLTHLETTGEYPAAIACNLLGKNGAKAPMFRQVIDDVPMVASENSERFISQIDDGSVIGYKYFIFNGKTTLEVQYKGTGDGIFEISNSKDGQTLGQIQIAPSETWKKSSAEFELSGKSGLFLRYKGMGSVQLLSLGF
jgi:hypothetical protein